MKNIITQIVVISALALLLQSCYDNPTFLEKNSVKGDGYYPVLSDVSGYNSQYKPGDTATFMMQYFSQGKIESITLDQQIARPSGDTTQSQVFSMGPDAGTFSPRLDLDTLAVSYDVPQLPDSTQITLKRKITNTNTLADSISFTFMVLKNAQ